MNGRCIVICAGSLSAKAVERKQDDFVIAADGGLDYCDILGADPDLIVGDFDSVGPGKAEFIEELERREPQRVLRLPAEKDDTDTLAALKEGLRRGFSDFRIYCATGGRFDHTFANVQCLLFLKKHNAAGYLIDESGMMFVLEDESISFGQEMKGSLSLFSLSQKAEGVTIRGMKYTLDNAEITNDFPIGISNEFTKEKAYISVRKGQLLIVIKTSDL